MRRGCSTAAPHPSRTPAAGERLADPEPEALHELGHRVRLHLEAVALAQRGHDLGAGGEHAAEIGELLEEALEAGGRDDLENPARLVSRVPEGVPLVAGLVHEIAGACDDDVVAEESAHSPLEDVAV